jgi:hypothetical protein
MIELLLPCGFDTLEYSWVTVTIDICTLVEYSVAKKCQHPANGGPQVGPHVFRGGHTDWLQPHTSMHVQRRPLCLVRLLWCQ